MDSELVLTVEYREYVPQTVFQVEGESEQVVLPDVFVLNQPILQVGIDVFADEVVENIPTWLSLYLNHERMTISSDNVGIAQEFFDAQGDLNSIYYSNQHVIGSGLTAGDLFDFV